MPDDTDLAATPPMGWNSWNAHSCAVTEADIRAAADAVVSTGLRDAGYEYVVVDDCWMADETADETAAEGRLRADPEAFPGGMAALADYVHDRGLKFGLYSSAGSHTCQGYPASLGRERVHAEQFADWGVDFLKYDNCGDHRGREPRDRYGAMGEALRSVDRDILYSICEWGRHDPWLWAREAGGHMWRVTDDAVAKWRVDGDAFGLGIADIIDRVADLDTASSHGPGGWSDPDMLQVGNGPDSGQSRHEPTDVVRPLTPAENRTHFAFWCLLGAPLFVGTDLTDIDEGVLDILTTDRLVAVDQDPLGAQGTPDRRTADAEVWSKPLHDGGAAVALWNRGSEPRDLRAHVDETALPSAADRYAVCDCWTGETWETAGDLRAAVDPRDTAVLRVTPA
ncbi:glycoside hydrolase family 27 protein [Haloarcula sp. S1CR25-12]|uniref:Glycoside hydrolase family 27 protein n=1 Tax=Haloarcula saliterrae TaxID=2950534 RepID=A0ABU2FHS3_9EURY|nr:glycoside hydrolase family 27 protein [Haloarcula sp. S1CR25-12]MDS0261276.1 glycoside hydrolase family 27 protein [Haloarcula sp. S1CR25-12]